MEERNYTKEQVLESIEKRREDSEKFIYPQKEFADLIINYFTDDFLR
jgi:uridine kinase